MMKITVVYLCWSGCLARTKKSAINFLPCTIFVTLEPNISATPRVNFGAKQKVHPR